MQINDMYSHTKHEVCGLDSFGVTLSFGQTEGQTERQTDTGKATCPRSFDAGHKKTENVADEYGSKCNLMTLSQTTNIRFFKTESFQMTISI